MQESTRQRLIRAAILVGISLASVYGGSAWTEAQRTMCENNYSNLAAEVDQREAMTCACKLEAGACVPYVNALDSSK